MEYFVPHKLIQKFTEKEGNSYRHTLAHRVYLFLVYEHSGRIKYDERKKIVQYLNTSHTALSKALTYLESTNLVTVKRGWISAKSKNNFGTSNYNIKFKFTSDDLTTSKKFYNKLFSCIYQTSAMMYGKSEYTLIPQQKSPSDSVMLKGGTVGKTIGTSCSEKTEFIQLQAASYLAKMTDRHENSSYKRIQSIKMQNVFSKNPDVQYETNGRTVLTVDGFLTRDYSKVIVYQTFEEASSDLALRRSENKALYKGCYVTNDPFGKFAIVKPVPHTYKYSIETEPIVKSLDKRYNKLK